MSALINGGAGSNGLQRRDAPFTRGSSTIVLDDLRRRVPDTTRVKELVGFAPTVDLHGIIRSVVEDQGR